MVTPYMVLGVKTVSWGVFSLGVSVPKAAMLLGWKILLINSSLATSRTFLNPLMFTFHARSGFISPVALRMAAR